jgi:2-aminoadipate transaminase
MNSVTNVEELTNAVNDPEREGTSVVSLQETTDTATGTEETLSLADWTSSIKRSALQDMLVAASQPDVLSFALGLPAPELFPASEYLRAAAHVVAHDSRALQYAPPFQPLKSHVVELMARRGVVCTEREVFLTAGAQQGLSLLTRLLLNSGAAVLTEELTYTGLQQAVQPLRPKFLTVPTDPDTGMDVDAVEDLLTAGARPAFIYTVTNGHNPLSVSLSADKRVRLAGLARRFRVPIIEDDPYGFLFYDGEPPPPLCAHDKRWVLHVGSFSKILAPALRVGWLVVPEELTPHLAVIKESSDIDTSTFSQRAVSRYLDEGHLPAHLTHLRSEYGARRDAMLRALEEHFPRGARWHKPTAGVFVWVELPEETDAARLLKLALETERVAFIPGSAFGVEGDGGASNCLRLNFSNSTPERIADGIARLGRVLRTM